MRSYEAYLIFQSHVKPKKCHFFKQPMTGHEGKGPAVALARYGAASRPWRQEDRPSLKIWRDRQFMRKMTRPSLGELRRGTQLTVKLDNLL
jgi:hypothetical protein